MPSRVIPGKGSSFERVHCVQFSLWVSDGERKDLFWRTAMSGGRSTVHKKAGHIIRQAGDMCAVAPEGFPFADLFYMEFKHLKSLNIAECIFKKTGMLAGIWDHTLREARERGKKPMVIARQNMFPTLVITAPMVLRDPPVRTKGLFGFDIDTLDKMLKEKWYDFKARQSS